MVLVEQHYKEVRRKLDEMGYVQPCSVESVLLVDRLLNDLTCLRDKLLLYEEVANNTTNKFEKMENTIGAYKKDNERLLRENNKMHLDTIRFKEESEKKIKALKLRIGDLENMYSDLEFNYMEQMTNIGTVRQELIKKTNRLYELGALEKEDVKNIKDLDNLPKGKWCNGNSCFESTKIVKDEIENYKKKQRQLLNEVEFLENKLESRDKEIARLGGQLVEKNYYTSRSDQKTCPCHLTNTHPPRNLLPAEMFEKVKAAQDKQHEAMQKAIILADHIQELESEINDLKKKNMTISNCACGMNITLLKKQHEDALNKVKDMEIRITNLQDLITTLTREKDESNDKIIALEKEKATLQEKLMNSKLIEKDLTSEIDRLQQNIADLKDEMAHLIEKNNLLNANKIPSRNSDERVSLMENKHINPSGNSNGTLCEKIKAERDYYCNELHRLQEKVYSAERMHDMQCCRRAENELDLKHVQKIRCELHLAKNENTCLQEEIVSLRNQLKELSSYKYDSNKLIDSHIKKLEHDKAILASSNANLKSKLRSTEKDLEQQSKKIDEQTEEVCNYKIKYNHLKKLNIQLELSLNNSEATMKRAESELTQAMTRINDLEKQLKFTQDEIILGKKQKQEIRENLLKLDSEKDELLLKIDEKTIVVSNLDRDLQRKSTLIAQIENKKCELQTEVQKLERMLQDVQDKCMDYMKSNRKMEQEIISLQNCNENMQTENQTLKKELAAVSQDIILTNKALEKSRQESENLKRELQTYVDEVRRVEKILQDKEHERDILLEQFNALSAEATHLENTQQSLECEANLSKDNLRDTQEKLYALQKDATAKESMVSVMEHQLRELSDQVVQLQAKISEMGDRELMFTVDLEAARNLCSTLEDQKQYYSSQLSQMASAEKVLRDELDRLECENETLHHQLSHQQKSSSALENMLTSSRHEAMEKYLFNEDLTKEVKSMKETIVALETKLNSVTSALSDCQSACADYHTQNIQLKRQITNERFEKAKDLDSNSTSL